MDKVDGHSINKVIIRITKKTSSIFSERHSLERKRGDGKIPVAHGIWCWVQFLGVVSVLYTIKLPLYVRRRYRRGSRLGFVQDAKRNVIL